MNRASSSPVLSRFNPAQPGTQGMKVIATGLLVVMAAVFAAARALEPRYPGLGYVKAFAEAAMVGGLADWFAVTALFRHPLGLPIPHTAIIPRNKDRIGEALARFIADNFLTPRVLDAQVRRLELAHWGADWLRAEGNAARLARRLAPAIPELLRAIPKPVREDLLGSLAMAAVRAV